MRAVRFGAPIVALAETDLVQSKTVLQIGVAPNRKDILMTCPGGAS